ncbi:MAG: acyl-CoA thioesterase [Ignavibacteriae bacterium HGW-Ignavibacteriae-3]|nr:MAG: acyl-CoA thioesterase [Ignavibacteriae bacterium HGW-Ignavibacteriae-3]
MEELKDYKHNIKIEVRFSDLDAMRHVNNAIYLTYLEEARISYFNDLFSLKTENLDYEAVVARIEIDYIRPIMLGDAVEVYTRISKLGIKSVDVEHIIAVREGEKLIKAAASFTKLVYFDYKNKTTKEIAEEVRKTIAEYEGLKI